MVYFAEKPFAHDRLIGHKTFKKRKGFPSKSFPRPHWGMLTRPWWSPSGLVVWGRGRGGGGRQSRQRIFLVCTCVCTCARVCVCMCALWVGGWADDRWMHARVHGWKRARVCALRETGSSSPSPKQCLRRLLAPARAQVRNPEGLRTPHLGQSGPRAGLLGAGQKRALGPRKCQAA